MSKIEWTDATWNPGVGCSRVSAGCEHCYAERFVHRGMSEAHKGLTVLGKKGPRWNGKVRFLPERLEQPLRWRKPRRIFVNSLSDLFHDGFSFEQIAAVFGVMAATPRHTYQVLTKRTERALEFFKWVVLESDRRLAREPDDGDDFPVSFRRRWQCMWEAGRLMDARRIDPYVGGKGEWPLRNVELGVSVEDQATADGRIPLLLRCPAALRFVSYEPALGPVRFDKHVTSPPDAEPPHDGCWEDWLTGRAGRVWGVGGLPRLDWIIVGGESGPGARPFDVAWARSTIRQCRDAGVPCFVKQLGALPWTYEPQPDGVHVPDYTLGDQHATAFRLLLKSRKGGDMSEWPEDLRVREMPGE